MHLTDYCCRKGVGAYRITCLGEPEDLLAADALDMSLEVYLTP